MCEDPSRPSTLRWGIHPKERSRGKFKLEPHIVESGIRYLFYRLCHCRALDTYVPDHTRTPLVTVHLLCISYSYGLNHVVSEMMSGQLQHVLVQRDMQDELNICPTRFNHFSGQPRESGTVSTISTASTFFLFFCLLRQRIYLQNQQCLRVF